MHHQAMRGIVAASIMSSTASANITSTFDTGAEGWTGIDLFAISYFGSFQWRSDLGNTPGAVSATDRGFGPIWGYSTWGFAASSDYHGDFSAYVGGTLSWDIMGLEGSQPYIPDRADVIIIGNGMSIGIDADVILEVGDWTNWSVALDADSGWRHVTSLSNMTLGSGVITAEEFESILSDVTSLVIRGGDTVGSGSSALDNVSLLVPSPATTSLFAVAAIVTRRRRRA